MPRSLPTLIRRGLLLAALLAGCASAAPDETHHHEAAAAAPAPHGGHEPAHGGLVMMDATYHVEIVLAPASGAHRVYVSDGARAPLPASTFDAVTLTVAGEPLAMTRTPADDAWQAAGRPAPTTGATVSIAYSRGGQPVARFDDLPIEYVLTGTMPDHHHAATSH